MEIRRFETKESAEKKAKARNIVIGVVIAFIMIFSVVGYAILDSNKQANQQGNNTYNGYAFTQTTSGWQTSTIINNNQYAINTFYLPKEVENITSSGSFGLADFSGKIIYMAAVTPLEQQGASRIAYSLQSFATRIQEACTEEQGNSSFCVNNNLPIKSCKDANQLTSIVIFNEDNKTNETYISYSSNCLTIKSSQDNFNRAIDKAIFSMFKIMT